MTPTAAPRVPIALSLGVLAVSFAAIFIRLADAPALIIASYRLAIGGAVIGSATGAMRLRSPMHTSLTGTVTRRDLLLLTVSTLSIAIHFWPWTASLERMSVTSAVVLVTANPLLVAVASRLFLSEYR